MSVGRLIVSVDVSVDPEDLNESRTLPGLILHSGRRLADEKTG